MKGIQTFVEGTSFDALNSIDFQYVIDVIHLNDNSMASGSRSYSVPAGRQMKAVLILSEALGPHPTQMASVTGSTVSWNIGLQNRGTVFVYME